MLIILCNVKLCSETLESKHFCEISDIAYCQKKQTNLLWEIVKELFQMGIIGIRTGLKRCINYLFYLIRIFYLIINKWCNILFLFCIHFMIFHNRMLLFILIISLLNLLLFFLLFLYYLCLFFLWTCLETHFLIKERNENLTSFESSTTIA